MSNQARINIVVGVTLLLSVSVGLFFLQRLFAFDPTRQFEVSLPGADAVPEGLDLDIEDVDLTGTLELFDYTPVARPAPLPGAWTRFRGSDFDNIAKNGVKLAESWGDGGPEVFWSVELGEGHAAPVVLNGRVYMLDYDEEKRRDSIRCFSLDDGEEIWRHSYKVKVIRNHGFSRAVPALTEDYLLTMGPNCHVVCLNPVSGEFLWGIDLQGDYGTTEPLWHTGQCPMIDNDQAIIAVGGDEVLMMGVDCSTGDVVWKTPNPNGWDMSHSSIMPMTFFGKRMYVYCAVGGAVGVSAEGADRGEVLWECPWNLSVIAPSPVQLAGNKIFVTAGYGAGSIMLKVGKTGEEFAAEILFRNGPKDSMASEQQTPIYYDGLLYGIMPKDAGALKQQFVCYDEDGKLVWSSGPANRFGLGPYLLADGKFFILSDDAVLTVLRVSRTKYEQLGQVCLMDGADAWGPFALAGGRLLLRDSKKMMCINVAAAQ